MVLDGPIEGVPVLNRRCFWSEGTRCWRAVTTAFTGEVERAFASPFQVSRGRRKRGSWVYLLEFAIVGICDDAEEKLGAGEKPDLQDAGEVEC
jgi:hypothetical protein